MEANTLTRLRSQMARAELILFTGAGFSLAARDRSGRSLPTVGELRRELWALCYPDKPFDEGETLGDLYQIALNRKRTQLVQLLESRLAADPDSLPEIYKLYFDLPWLRIYTLNVDDLAHAVGLRYSLTRKLDVISATTTDSEAVPRSRQDEPRLEVIHLNGSISNTPETLTFSETQYAKRIANKEPWYARCVADLFSRPTVFIGTELREIPLWEHIELRRQRSAPRVDPRPASILVSPKLTPARQETLHDLRVEWIPGTAETFAREVLDQLTDASKAGFTSLGNYSRSLGRTKISLVSELAATNPTLDTEYLSGQEPYWSDIITNRAVQRTHDLPILDSARDILKGKRPNSALVITGTAGTGKSTTLMRTALALSNEGIPVVWIDKDTNVPPSAVRERIRSESGPIALAIDDADLMGRMLAQSILDLVPNRNNFLFMFALRSSKFDAIAFQVKAAKSVKLVEHSVPGLTDSDIEGLMEALDRCHRLGSLKGKSAADRRRAFSSQAGRQLLVAMINATSDDRFEEKARSEVEDLQGVTRYVYSLICVASSLRQYLTKDEVLLAASNDASEAAEALERLSSRHVIVSLPPAYEFRARHRVIAELVVQRLQVLDVLKDVLSGLAFAAASKVNPAMAKQERPWKFLNRVMNHEFLGGVLGIMAAREVYAEIEGLVSFDYHYWLQRGSMEVQKGDLKLAEQFLDQARSLAPDDYLVSTAYGYLQMRKATDYPTRQHAKEQLDAGIELLEEVIADHGKTTPYPFHVLGSQGMAWARRGGITDPAAKRMFLERLLRTVKQGSELHPFAKELWDLIELLKKEVLLTTVEPGA